MKKYIEHIKEGLIKTYNIEKYYNSLDIELSSIGVKSKINIISKFIYDLEISNPQELSNDKLKYIIDINKNLLGYYPSYIWIENNIGINGFKFNNKYLSNKYLNIKIRFESKYEDGLYKNDLEVPKISYHLSPSKNRNKILDIGLYPKSGNRKTFHMDRIYLFYNLDDYKRLLKLLKMIDKINSKYDLYEISLTDKNIIHSDPNYINGFYTYDNISPINITILKQDLE